MDQPKDEVKKKKVYQKLMLTKVELIAEEAVLSACKEGLAGGCEELYTCNLAPGS